MSDVMEKIIPATFGEMHPLFLGITNLRQSMEFVAGMPDVELPPNLISALQALYAAINTIKFVKEPEGEEQ